MMTRTFTTIAAAAALTATPVMAQSIDAERASAPVAQAEQLGEEGRGPGLILALLAAAAIIAGIYIALEDEDDDGDLPVSP